MSASYHPDLPSSLNRRFVAEFRRRYPRAGLPTQPVAAAYDVPDRPVYVTTIKNGEVLLAGGL